MVKEICTRASSNNCVHWWGEKFASLNKILPVHQDYNPNDQERISNSQVGSEHAKCYSEHNSECIPFHVNMHADCLSFFYLEPMNQLFGGMEMGLHLSDWTKACQSKRWPQACAHARDVIGRNWINPSNKKKNPNVPKRQIVPEMISHKLS